MRSIAYLLLTGLVALAAVPYVLPPSEMRFDDGHDPMGVRLFRTTSTRTQISLAGWWDFRTDPTDCGRSQNWGGQFPKPETELWVPGTWNTNPRYWTYIGPAWFRRTLELPRSGNLLLRFTGVFYDAEVWLDGKRLGGHEGGYAPFEFVVSKLAPGPHTVVVRADSRTTETTLPKKNVDWFPYGGIHREVYAELIPDVSVAQFRVVPDAGRLRVTARVRNLGSAAGEQPIELAVDGKVVYSARHRVDPGQSTIEFTAALPRPVRTWSPESPALYSAQLRIGGGTDDQFTRFGIRTIEVKGPAILLNGERLIVRGANRHEDHPDWGSALPAHLVRRDVEILKSLGANTVRSHYPSSELFMDYCDEAGLLYMSELPAWQYGPKQLALSEVQERIRVQFREMVDRDLGRASILSWSLGNEWFTPDKSIDAIRSLVEYARTVDRTHPLTLITVGYSGPVHDLLDVITTNWGLHEWYDDAVALDEQQKKESIAKLDRIHARNPNKPLIITEFGGAESQAGWHNWGNAKWSEEYQAGNVSGSGEFGLRNDWISGGCVWQFSDSRTAPERILSARLHGWNSKGIVDAYRQPKMAFYALQQIYRSYERKANQ